MDYEKTALERDSDLPKVTPGRGSSRDGPDQPHFLLSLKSLFYLIGH